MFKKSVFLGFASGILAGIASVIYAHVYNTAMGCDFSKIAKPIGIFATCLFAGMLAAVCYPLFIKWLKGKGDIVFNLIFVILTFASIIGPFAANLPLDVKTPELFPGLVIPMHFFPVLGWLTLKPMFIKE